MGSLDKYCRICALCVRPDHLLKLWDDSGGGEDEKSETANCDKIRNFLGFEVSYEDRLPKQVCVQCINNLDYCVQFVDKCRRIESLLQRGLDLDYVANEIDYRYTYLFPSPYGGQENRPTYPDLPDTDVPYFGSTRSTDEPVPQERHVNERTHPREQENSHYHPREFQGDQEGYIPPAGGLQDTQTSVVKMTPDEEKVPMYRNDVSVDNLVVEIEPNDIFPKKSGGVKPEYPWKVGGATKKSNLIKDRKIEVSRERSVLSIEKQSPGKRVRSILPKADAPGTSSFGVAPPLKTSPTPQSSSSPGTGQGQIMIPVTLKTPCKVCNKFIVASSLNDLKNHVCSLVDEKKVLCPDLSCGKKFSSKNALKYHQKHCHPTSPPVQKKEVDIMLIATSELVGAGDKDKGELQLIGNQENFSSNLGGYLDVTHPNRPKRSFVCPYKGCMKSYTAKNYLVQHERIHTGERPYSCKNCGKDFSRVLDMKKHQLLKVCY